MDRTRPGDADMSRLFDAALDEPLELAASPQHSLYFLSGSREGERVTLPDQGAFRLGREPDSDVVFPSDKDPMVSGRHMELRIEEDHIQVVDLGSTNGTYVNGSKLDQPLTLKDRDQIELGHPGVRMIFLKAATGQ